MRSRDIVARTPPAAVLVGLTALLIRLPALFSQPPHTFDEGVYGASVFAMRNGGRPFHDVFSSQGPLFLPLLRLADFVGFEAHWAPRLATVGAGVLIALGCYFVAALYTTRTRALSVGLLVASSGAVLEAAGPLQSEGPALAFGLVAVLVALRDEGRGRWRPWVAGALAGGAVAIKSVFVFPVVAAAIAVYAHRRRYGALVAAAGAATLVLAGSILPWGWDAVYQQSIAFQRAVPRTASMINNLVNVVLASGRYDVVLLIATALATAAWGSARWKGRGAPRPATPLLPAGLVWVAGSLILLIGFLGPGIGYRRYLAVIVIPVALLIGVSRLSTRLLLTLALVAVPIQLATQPEIHGSPVTESERAALAFMADLPAGTMVLTDEPGLAWWAERMVPADLNDTSSARIEAGNLTESYVVEALRAPEVCAYVPWSDRFAEWFSIDPTDYGYVLIEDLGEGKLLYLRSDCRTG